MEDLEKDVQKSSVKPKVVKNREYLQYEGKEEMDLKNYLDSDPKYHNWSRSCDAGH